MHDEYAIGNNEDDDSVQEHQWCWMFCCGAITELVQQLRQLRFTCHWVQCWFGPATLVVCDLLLWRRDEACSEGRVWLQADRL